MRKRLRLTPELGIAAVLIALLCAPVGGCLWYMHRVHKLDSAGITAEGVVIGGESGTTMDNSLYCVETVQFLDAHGATRFTKRSCPGGSPVAGEKVTVHYDAVYPDKAYVDGDHNYASIAATIVVLLGSLLISAIRSGAPEKPAT